MVPACVPFMLMSLTVPYKDAYTAPNALFSAPSLVSPRFSSPFAVLCYPWEELTVFLLIRHTERRDDDHDL